MLNWFHHLLNPHCPHCIAEKERKEFCKGCDILQYEVERLRAENQQLLSRVLHIPEKEPERTIAPEPMSPIKNRNIPWAVRRQMLEAEDREKARLLRQAPQPSESIEALEQEVLNAEIKREAEYGTGKV